MRRTLAAALLSLLCASIRVHAQPANTIALELPGCLDESQREQLINIASLELRDDGASVVTSPLDSARAPTIRIAVELACSSDLSEARIHLAHPANTDVLTRTLQLSDTPQHLRARTLALALAELWRASMARLNDTSRSSNQPPESRQPPGPPNPPQVVAADSGVSAPDEAPSAPTLSVAPALRLYIGDRTALPGAQIAFSWRAWRVGAEGFYRSQDDVLGSASFGLVQGYVSWELARMRFGDYGLSLAPRAAMGGIFAAAAARAPAFASSASVVSWDASGEAAFWRMLSNSWRLALRVQVGYAHGTVLASSLGQLARLHGLFATASLALELHLTD